MNIALFPSAFHPSLGGVEELSLRLAQAYQSLGHGVRVYTERWPRDLPHVDSVEGIDVRRFAFRVPQAPGLKPKLTWAAALTGTNRALRSDLKAFRPNVIHIQCVSSAVDYALPAADKLGLPLVVTLQGELTMDADGIYLKPGPSQQRMLRALQHAAAITACSQQTLREANDFYVENGRAPFSNRGRVIYNGINLQAFEQITPHQHNKPYLFALGRHVHQKGFDLLIRAMTQIPDSHDLLLAGDGPDHDQLKKLAHDLGLQERVSFTGRLDAQAVRSHMKAAELFVLASRHEPFGIVNLEAMAAGTPVVATRVGGVPEFVRDNQCGLLVQPNSADALASGINALINESARAARLAKQAAQEVKNFDWRQLATQYLEVLEQTETSAGPAKTSKVSV